MGALRGCGRGIVRPSPNAGSPARTRAAERAVAAYREHVGGRTDRRLWVTVPASHRAVSLTPRGRGGAISARTLGPDETVVPELPSFRFEGVIWSPPEVGPELTSGRAGRGRGSGRTPDAAAARRRRRGGDGEGCGPLLLLATRRSPSTCRRSAVQAARGPHRRPPPRSCARRPEGRAPPRWARRCG